MNRFMIDSLLWGGYGQLSDAPVLLEGRRPETVIHVVLSGRRQKSGGDRAQDALFHGETLENPIRSSRVRHRSKQKGCAARTGHGGPDRDNARCWTE